MIPKTNKDRAFVGIVIKHKLGSVSNIPLGIEGRDNKDTVLLVTEIGSLFLMRKDGQSHNDEILNKLVGLKIKAKGNLIKNYFIIYEWEILSDD